MTFGPTVDPVLLPPNIEQLARAYLLGPLTPTPIATRLPSPDKAADTVNGFLRTEAAGGFRSNRLHYDTQCLLHAYSPNETQAKQIAAQAVALMAAARGQIVNGWYVVGVMNVVLPHRLTDPNVSLPRFRSMVTWRVAGQQWTP